MSDDIIRCENCKMTRLCDELERMGKAPKNENCRCDSQTRPITNAYRVRSMKDDLQLAIFFASVSGCPYDREIALDKCDLWSDDCVSCWLDWLKQEAT